MTNNLAERIAAIRRWSRIAADMEATAAKNGISSGESKNERKLRNDIDLLIAHVEELEREVAELGAMVTFLSKYTEHTIPLDQLREQLGIKKW